MKERARADAEVEKSVTVEGLVRELYATVSELRKRSEDDRATSEARRQSLERELRETKEAHAAVIHLNEANKPILVDTQEKDRLLKAANTEIDRAHARISDLERMVDEAKAAAAGQQDMLAKAQADARLVCVTSMC